MLGGSSSNTATTAAYTIGSSSTMNKMSSKNIFPCNTCDLVFENSQAQRTHMREPWHVYNLKRRMASLAPISADTYSENVATRLVSSKPEPSSESGAPVVMKVKTLPQEKRVEERSDEVEDLNSESEHVNQCLFCTNISNSLENNIDHMSTEHGLYIPQIKYLSSLDSIIGYLRTVITEYNECIYCGMIRQSAEGIRRHMLDKGHCMINLEREPELLEFWDLSDSDEYGTDDDDAEVSPSRTRKADPFAEVAISRDLSEGQYMLPSGKVIGSKSKAREAHLLARRTALATKEASRKVLTEGTTDTADKDRPTTDLIASSRKVQGGGQGHTIAKRDATGLMGVPDQQVRSLIAVERKMQRQQAIVQASADAASWAGELGGTHQKHYKTKMNLRAG